MPIYLIAIIVVLLLFIFKGKSVEEDKVEDLFIGGTPENGHPQYGTPTITKVKAKAIAEELYQEMGLTYFTSESKLVNILSPLNEADYILVNEAFGLRAYNETFNEAASGVASWVFGSQNYNLTQWLTYEVTGTKNKQFLKNQFPNFF